MRRKPPLINKAASPVGLVSDINDLGDVSITSAADGDLLQFDGSNWVNVGEADLTIDHGALTGLSDNDHPQYARHASSETITGAWAFTVNGSTTPAILIESANPWMGFRETDAGADEKHWRWGVNGGDFRLFTATDAAPGSPVATPINIQRSSSSTAIDEIELNATTLDFNGNVDVSGALTAASYGGITEANLLDKSATETISGVWTFNTDITITDTQPQLNLIETGVSANEGWWNWQVSNGSAFLLARTDAGGSGESAISVHRTGTSIDEIQLDADLLDFNGTAHFSEDVNFESGGELRIYDSTNTDTLSLFHNGSNARIENNAGSIQVVANSVFDILSGASFRIRDAGQSDYATFRHDGTDFITSFTNTTDWDLNDLNRIVMSAGGSKGDVGIVINADSDNTVESANPYVRFLQDGGVVEAVVGQIASAGEDSLGNTFTGSVTNGFAIHQRYSSGGIGIGVGGTVGLLINSSNRILGTAGTVSAPAYAFINDQDTGMYNSGSNVLRFSTGGGNRATLYSSHLRLESGTTLSISETANANSDLSGYGQWWVKSNTPNEPWFTDDAGTDHHMFQYLTAGYQGGGHITVSSTAPGSPTQGDIWFDTS